MSCISLRMIAFLRLGMPQQMALWEEEGRHRDPSHPREFPCSGLRLSPWVPQSTMSPTECTLQDTSQALLCSSVGLAEQWSRFASSLISFYHLLAGQPDNLILSKSQFSCL